jgi:CheY-like chemotaxis protein
VSDHLSDFGLLPWGEHGPVAASAAFIAGGILPGLGSLFEHGPLELGKRAHCLNRSGVTLGLHLAAESTNVRGMSTSPDILLVDDDPQVLATTKMLLKSGGITSVVTARSASEAQEMWEQHKGHLRLLLTDLQLGPRPPSGEDLAKVFHSEKPALRSIILSAFPTAYDSKRVEGRDYFLKPYSVKDLLGAVRAAIQTA